MADRSDPASPARLPGCLRSGEVAAAAGVNVQTLHYYERRGLLTQAGRTSSGHRQYPARTVTLVRMIKSAQRLGFSLDEVAAQIARLTLIREALAIAASPDIVTPS